MVTLEQADAMVTWLVLGDCIDAPKWGRLNVMPQSAPTTPDLYEARIKLLHSVKTPYFCLLDGGEDRLCPNFNDVMLKLLLRMHASGAAIGYADESEDGVRYIAGPYMREKFMRIPQMIHHGVLCRTERAMAIPYPNGNFLFEVVTYGTLAEQGFEYEPAVCYEWNRTAGGARTWPDCARALVNSLLWLDQMQPVSFPHEMRNISTLNPSTTES